MMALSMQDLIQRVEALEFMQEQSAVHVTETVEDTKTTYNEDSMPIQVTITRTTRSWDEPRSSMENAKDPYAG